MNQAEARAALDSVNHARQRTGELIAYQIGSSVVAAWGVAWVVGFCTMQFAPAATPLVWAACWLGALGWTVTRPRAPHDGPAMASWAVAVAFVALVVAILRADVREASVITALAVAAGYSIAGLWAGWRFLALGGLITLAVIVGWWVLPAYLFLTLGLGGGLVLILGALWFKRP